MSVTNEVKGPKYQIIDGFKFPPKIPTESIKSGLKYKPKDSDLFVVTYMKSGTTWTQQICTLIFNDGIEPKALSESGLFNVSPFLEWLGSEGVQSMPDPKIIKTHLPFNLQPYNPKAK
ncbi:sulfotransferase 1C2-like protein, partial [Leptotrombidium deliense]